MGDSYDEAQVYAKKCVEEEGHMFIPSFDHPDVIIDYENGGTDYKICYKRTSPIYDLKDVHGGSDLMIRR